MSPGIFVPGEARLRELRQPECGTVFECIWLDRIEHRFRRADMTHNHLVAKHPARQQQMA